MSGTARATELWTIIGSERLAITAMRSNLSEPLNIEGALMAFHLRKSISVGPFRFNLSKSGIGLSVVVHGLRVGTGPRGHYIHAGASGFYYRASIGRVDLGG